MDCACEGVYSRVDRHVGNERPLLGVLPRFEWCRGLNGGSATEVLYLGLDHVDKDCGPWLSWEAIARWSHSSATRWKVSQSKDKYNSLFILCCVCCIQF